MFLTSRKPDMCRNKLFGISLTSCQPFSSINDIFREVKIAFARVREWFEGRQISEENLEEIQIFDFMKKKLWEIGVKTIANAIVRANDSVIVGYRDYTRSDVTLAYKSYHILLFLWEYSECSGYLFSSHSPSALFYYLLLRWYYTYSCE